MRRSRLLLGGVLFILLGIPPAHGQDPPTKAKGKISIGDHRVKMDVGMVYEIRVEAEGFLPNVQIKPGYFITPRVDRETDTFTGFFVPKESREHRILIIPDIYDELGAGPFDYGLTVKPI